MVIRMLFGVVIVILIICIGTAINAFLIDTHVQP